MEDPTPFPILKQLVPMIDSVLAAVVQVVPQVPVVRQLLVQALLTTLQGSYNSDRSLHSLCYEYQSEPSALFQRRIC